MYRESDNEELRRFEFRIEESGYPDESISLYTLCPQLNTCLDGQKLTGVGLKKLLDESALSYTKNQAL